MRGKSFYYTLESKSTQVKKIKISLTLGGEGSVLSPLIFCKLMIFCTALAQLENRRKDDSGLLLHLFFSSGSSRASF